MKSPPLTSRQTQVLHVIRDHIEQHGFPPTLREIAQQLRIRSVRGVQNHLEALQKKGYLERSSRPRSIRLTHKEFRPETETVMIPLLGTIAAGAPILAEEYVEDLIPVPKAMIGRIRNAFLLRVKGDSMINEGILPRDLVIVRPQETARHGDLVAVLVEGEATVKRIHFEKNGLVRLMPANAAYDPIIIRSADARVLGKVIGLLRDYEGNAF
ncbi:MAG: transcriptional repressor LexA [Armatimonadetes bacterium]|nr:MAG: transcriptional repressor LexA [Armatimonadota bacterium]GIV01857.1 MAG: LexA repressor 2 [Fimbriimonadales bacterium]